MIVASIGSDRNIAANYTNGSPGATFAGRISQARPQFSRPGVHLFLSSDPPTVLRFAATRMP